MNISCIFEYQVIRFKILAILNTEGLEVENSDLILQEIGLYAEKKVDFIDAYNAARMLKQDIKVAVTFDQKHFDRFEGITVEQPR